MAQHTDTKTPNRITALRKPPDFTSFFEKRFNRPPRLIKKRALLFSDGDPLDKLFFIQEGFVKLYRMSDEGRDTIAYLYGPGYVVGLRALLSQEEVAKHSAEALTDLRIISVSQDEYFAILSRHPHLLSDLVHYFMDRLEYTETKVEMFVAMNVTARIAHFFLDFLEKYDGIGSETTTLPLKFTHQMIADFVGASRETVTIAMNRLQKKGVLTDKRGEITITNLTKLRKLSLK